VVVARDSAEVVGIALAEPGRDRDGTGVLLPELCHVSMVFVDPDLWGRGIGRLLLDTVTELAADAATRSFSLWTGQVNQRARRLYQSAGFRTSGRDKWLDTGEQVVQLVRSITRMTAPERLYRAATRASGWETSSTSRYRAAGTCGTPVPSTAV